MWLKIVLLALCLLALFILSRILEATLLGETGLFSTTILDPVSLSVRQLKRILESRGVSYVGVLEKRELTNLVETSGHVTEGELLESTPEEVMTAQSSSYESSTHFTCGNHFYEEVEDTKDSVWLVQVIPSESRTPPIDDYNWRQVVTRMKPFGIRTGVLNCYLDKRLCNRKGWHVPQLLLALPRGSRAKDSVIFKSITQVTKSEAVISWVRDQLASHIKVVSSETELTTEWFNDSASIMRVLLLSKAKELPLFFTALSMKFAGRATFGFAYNLSVSNGSWADTSFSKLPVYVVITPEGIFPYGTRAGQSLNFKSMEFFLRTLQPELNDVFIISLILTNLLACLDFFLIEGKLWKHLAKCFWVVIKHNCILFLAWLAVLGLSHFPLLEVIVNFFLKVMRTAAVYNFTSLLWCDLRYWTASPHSLLVVLLVLGTVHAWISKRWFPSNANNSLSTHPAVGFSVDDYIMNWFFRPMATLTRPVVTDVDFAEEMEMLIERLAMPNFWLQPVARNHEYIDNLPLWKHQVSTIHADNQMSPEHSNADSDMEQNCTSTSEEENAVFTADSISDSQSSVSNSDEHSAFAEPRTLTSHWTSLLQSLAHGYRTLWHFCRKLRTRILTKRIFRKSSRSRCQKQLEGPPFGTIPSVECAICLERYQHEDVLCGLPCGHNFHQHCILCWLLRDKHHCPICRWPSYKMKSKKCLNLQT